MGKEIHGVQRVQPEMGGREVAPGSEIEEEPQYVRVSAYRVMERLNQSVMDRLVVNENRPVEVADQLKEIRSKLRYSDVLKRKILLLRSGDSSDSEENFFRTEEIREESLVPAEQIINYEASLSFPVVELLENLTKLVVDESKDESKRELTSKERDFFMQEVRRKLSARTVVFHLKAPSFSPIGVGEEMTLHVPENIPEEEQKPGQPKVRTRYVKTTLQKASVLESISLE